MNSLAGRLLIAPPDFRDPDFTKTVKAACRTHKDPATMAKSKADAFTGRWQIVSMDQWDEEYLNEEGQALIEFEQDQTGQFQFGYVQGEIDYRATTRDEKPAVEFTWDGHDEMEAAQGRGWAVLEGEELKGEIFFHLGDESGLVAKRAVEKPKRKKK